jgi:hypothetical protein
MIFTITNTPQTVARTVLEQADKIMLESMVITIENMEEDLRGITICMMEDGDWDALGDDTGEREDELVLILKQAGLNMDGGEEVERHFDKGSCHYAVIRTSVFWDDMIKERAGTLATIGGRIKFYPRFLPRSKTTRPRRSRRPRRSPPTSRP